MSGELVKLAALSPRWTTYDAASKVVEPPADVLATIQEQSQ